MYRLFDLLENKLTKIVIIFLTKIFELKIIKISLKTKNSFKLKIIHENMQYKNTLNPHTHTHIHDGRVPTTQRF